VIIEEVEDDWERVLPGPDFGTYIVQLDVGLNGRVYGVDNDNMVHYRLGITPELKIGTSWIREDNNFIGMNNVAHCSNGLFYGV